MIKTKLLVPAVALFALAGCQTNGDMYRSDVYGSNQVNQAQQVQTVEIIAIQPARVAVNNQSDRNVSQMVGTALGGILGAVIGNQVTHHRDSGTAIVVTAALINALRVVGKKMEDVHIVLNGPGAAGTAIILSLIHI